MQKTEHIVYEFAVIVAIVGSIALCSQSYRFMRVQAEAASSIGKTSFTESCRDDFTRANGVRRSDTDVACGLWWTVERRDTEWR